MQPLTPQGSDAFDLPAPQAQESDNPDGHDQRDAKDLRKLLRKSEARELRLRKRIRWFESQRDAEIIRVRTQIAAARVAQVAKRMKPSPREDSTQ